MLTIFGVPFSAHTRKVLIVLREKQLPHEVVGVVPILREGPLAPPPDWPSLSPLGTIPALRHGDVTLADSSVIIQYLERRFPDRPVMPAAPEAHARALWIEEYVDGALQQHVLRGVLVERAFAKIALGREPDEALIEGTLRDHIPPRLAYLDEQLGGRDRFAGGTFSVADVTVLSILVNYTYAGCALDPDRYPRLHGFLHAGLRRPSVRETLAAELPMARQLPTLDRTWLEGALA